MAEPFPSPPLAGEAPRTPLRVTFGLIVLDGEPFTRYCLRALYPFAHQIIVVEGACSAAAGIATADGHSRDGTLEILRAFARDEDPQGKIQIVTKDGFWLEKDEMSQAYAERCTGDILWQIDIDEFYHPRDMARILELFAARPELQAASLHQIQFWGGFEQYVDGWYLMRGGNTFHRVFRWQPGYRYAAHRPPTVVDGSGIDLRRRGWLSDRELAREGIFLYHYSLVFPKQVMEKCEYYSKASWADREGALRWAEEEYLRLARPFRLHNVYEFPGWLERFTGEHPPQARALMADVASGAMRIEVRPLDDIRRLLDSPWYRLGKSAMRIAEPLDRFWRRACGKAGRVGSALCQRIGLTR